MFQATVYIYVTPSLIYFLLLLANFSASKKEKTNQGESLPAKGICVCELKYSRCFLIWL